jgi:hypothetical protein
MTAISQYSLRTVQGLNFSWNVSMEVSTAYFHFRVYSSVYF